MKSCYAEDMMIRLKKEHIDIKKYSYIIIQIGTMDYRDSKDHLLEGFKKFIQDIKKIKRDMFILINAVIPRSDSQGSFGVKPDKISVKYVGRCLYEFCRSKHYNNIVYRINQYN